MPASKISEYDPKTTFLDTDLYDCSTGGTTTESVTWGQQKDHLRTIFVEKEDWGSYSSDGTVSGADIQIPNVGWGSVILSKEFDILYVIHNNLLTIHLEFRHAFTHVSGSAASLSNTYKLNLSNFFNTEITPSAFFNAHGAGYIEVSNNTTASLLTRDTEYFFPISDKLVIGTSGIPAMTIGDNHTVTFNAEFTVRLN